MFGTQERTNGEGLISAKEFSDNLVTREFAHLRDLIQNIFETRNALDRLGNIYE